MKIPGIRFGGVGDFLLVFDVIIILKQLSHYLITIRFT